MKIKNDFTDIPICTKVLNAIKMCKFDKLNGYSVVHGKGAAFFLQHFPSLYCAPICSLPVTSRCHYYYSFCDITYVVPTKVTENYYVIICISGYYECKWNKCYFDWKSSVSRFRFLLKPRTLWKTEDKVNLINRVSISKATYQGRVK